MKAANPQIAAGAEKKKRRKSLRKIGKTRMNAAMEELGLNNASELYEQLDLAAPDHPAVLARLAGFAHVTGDQDEAISLADLAFQEARLRGEVDKLETVCDTALADNESINFNAGSHTESLQQGPPAQHAAPERSRRATP